LAISRFLWLADRRGDAADGCADRGVHHEPAQERPELLERARVKLRHAFVAGRIVLVLMALAGGGPVIHVIEAEARP
jgi:hypothetical protein